LEDYREDQLLWTSRTKYYKSNTMKVIFIGEYEHGSSPLGKVYTKLTLGKVYDVIEELNGMYRIDNKEGLYLAKRFITLEEHRDIQLNKILRK